MGDRFVLCAGCSRHAKACEVQCPFCGTDLAGALPSRGEPFRRMAAAAAVAAGVAALPGCTAGNTTLATFYGIGNPGPSESGDAASEGAAGNDAAGDAPAVGVFYGLANPMPLEAGAPDVDAGEPPDAGDEAPG